MTFTYLYDFGDNWEHTVEVEKFQEMEDVKAYPLCIEGQLACPQEDSGGVHGFYHNLEILKDKKHPDYAFVKECLGRGYNPEKFNIDKVNKELPKFKSYRKHWR